MRKYVHPQGATITVAENGAVVKVNKAGKVVSTSATAEKLAAGHGGWVEVTSDAPAPEVVVVPKQKAAPAKILLPMKFREAPVADLPKYVTDPAWAMQQKLDGIRAQLVFAPGEKPWFRNGTGGVLASATAHAATNPILARLDGDRGAAYAVDGEVIAGAFYAFDLVLDGGEKHPLDQRLAVLAAWHDLMVAAGLDDRIRLLPTARTLDDKAALAEAVYTQGGEGWIAKRLDSPYSWGTRVEHSLKVKITSTVDCVVIQRNRDGKCNFVLGVHVGGVLSEVGCASAIGKPDAGVGSVVEVKYLYTGADGRLVQPTVLRERFDKPAATCDSTQLRHVNKSVVTL